MPDLEVGESVPELTVLLAVPSAEDASSALSSLLLNSMKGCKVIVIHAGDLPATLDNPNVSYLRCEGLCLFGLWAAGLRRALSGDYVAVLDARCPPCPQWLLGVRSAMADGVAAFFGPVTCDVRGDSLASTVYLLEYAQFSRPLQVHLHEVPGNNFIFKRSLLDDELLDDAEFHKVFFVQRLRASGCIPRLRDDVEVTYRKTYSWRTFLLRRFAHGRTYAARRTAGAATIKRCLLAAGTPGLPALRVVRTVSVLLKKNFLLKMYGRNAALAVTAEIAWSLGEAAGYLSGRAGNAKFMD